MKDGKPIKTPMGTNGHLDLDTGGKSVDQKVYRSMIGSLLYLCASRPDIMLSVCMCARFQADPKEVHLRAVLGAFFSAEGPPSKNTFGRTICKQVRHEDIYRSYNLKSFGMVACLRRRMAPT
jgi:hypothetical protein